MSNTKCKGHYLTFHLDDGESVITGLDRDDHETVKTFVQNCISSNSGWCSIPGRDDTLLYFDRSHIIHVVIECVT